MGLFGRKKKSTSDWSHAYVAAPKFYARPDGSPLGAIALTEETETVLPLAPEKEYAVDGKTVSEWRLLRISPSRGGVIGDCDYFTALQNLQQYVVDSKPGLVLIRALSTEELEAIRS